MDFKFDDNILWILGILALVFFLFPQKNTKAASKEAEEKQDENCDCIYRRKSRERKRLVY